MISYFFFYFLLHVLQISPSISTNINQSKDENWVKCCFRGNFKGNDYKTGNDYNKGIEISVEKNNKIFKTLVKNDAGALKDFVEPFGIELTFYEWIILNKCLETDSEKLSSDQLFYAIDAVDACNFSKPLHEEEKPIINILLEKAHKKLTLADFKEKEIIAPELHNLYNNLISFNNFYYSAKATEIESMIEYDLLNLLSRYESSGNRRRYSVNFFTNPYYPFLGCETAKLVFNVIPGLILYAGYKLTNQPACMSICSTWFIFESFIPMIKTLFTDYYGKKFYRISRNPNSFRIEYPFYSRDISYDQTTNTSTVKFQREVPKERLDDGVWEEFYIDEKIKSAFKSEDLLCLNYIKENNEFWCYDIKKEKHIRLQNECLVYAVLDASVYLLVKLSGDFDYQFFNGEKKVFDISSFLKDYTESSNIPIPRVSEIIFAREHNGKIVETKSLITSKESGFANMIFAKNHQRLVVIEPQGKMIDYNLSLACKEKNNIEEFISLVEDRKSFLLFQKKVIVIVSLFLLYMFFSNKIEQRKKHQALHQVFLDTIKSNNWAIFTKVVQRIILGSYAKMPYSSDRAFIRRIVSKNEKKLQKKLDLYFY